MLCYVTTLLYHDCVGLVGTTLLQLGLIISTNGLEQLDLIISTNGLEAVNNLQQV